jgi:MFS family permease
MAEKLQYALLVPNWPGSVDFFLSFQVIAPYFIAGCFSFGTAAAKDIQTVLLTRFFAGLFGSAPITNTGGVLGDIWSPEHRGTAIVGYAFAVVGGPTLGT